MPVLRAGNQRPTRAYASNHRSGPGNGTPGHSATSQKKQRTQTSGARVPRAGNSEKKIKKPRHHFRGYEGQRRQRPKAVSASDLVLDHCASSHSGYDSIACVIQKGVFKIHPKSPSSNPLCFCVLSGLSSVKNAKQPTLKFCPPVWRGTP
eukprot:2418239-Amphidinium_carterae.2